MAKVGRLIRFSYRTSDDRVAQCPQGKRWIVTSLFVCNTTAAAITFRLHHCIPPEASSTGNALFYDARVAPNTTTALLSNNDRLAMGPTDELRGLASATGLTIIGYGYEEDA